MSNQDRHDEHELHLEGTHHHGVAYEDRDLGARGIIVFLVVLGVSGLALCLIVWGYFDWHAQHMRGNVPIAQAPAVGTPNGAIPGPTERFPKPSLQVDDVADMHEYRETATAQLNSYGYIDKKAGVVHIPIGVAMDIVAKQGLPTRPQAVVPSAANEPGVADFGSGADTVAGAGGGVRPENN